jgi:hypothetical protein
MNERLAKMSKVTRLLLFAPLAILGMMLFAFIGGQIVLLLWNWLMPTLFGIGQINFWQALGILVLCRILFGGFGMSGSQRSHSGRGVSDRIADRVAERVAERLDQRYENMTPEERERFRQRVRERWGAGETKPL